MRHADSSKDLLQRWKDEVEDELAWMYETLHTDGKTKGRINYTVWSEVFTCPECTEEIVFVEEALDRETKRTRAAFPCSHCTVELNKNRLQRCFETLTDPIRGVPWKRIRLRPNHSRLRAHRARYRKVYITNHELSNLSSIAESPVVRSARFSGYSFCVETGLPTASLHTLLPFSAPLCVLCGETGDIPFAFLCVLCGAHVSHGIMKTTAGADRLLPLDARSRCPLQRVFVPPKGGTPNAETRIDITIARQYNWRPILCGSKGR